MEIVIRHIQIEDDTFSGQDPRWLPRSRIIGWVVFAVFGRRRYVWSRRVELLSVIGEQPTERRLANI
jgi:hypothetical protein